MQPGDTITPEHKSSKAETELKVEHNAKPVSTTPPIAASKAKEPEPITIPAEAKEAPSPWQYAQDVENDTQLPTADLKPVNWTASEFVEHEKNNTWFMGLAGVTVLAVALIYLITRDLITVIVIAIAAGLFGATAKRKPRTLQYQLDNAGIHIGSKFYDYDLFRSFSVLEEGPFSSIQLMPIKRFMPAISLYYPPESEGQVINTLGSYLPHEERPRDPIDNLMRKVRF